MKPAAEQRATLPQISRTKRTSPAKRTPRTWTPRCRTWNPRRRPPLPPPRAVTTPATKNGRTKTDTGIKSSSYNSDTFVLTASWVPNSHTFLQRCESKCQGFLWKHSFWVNTCVFPVGCFSDNWTTVFSIKRWPILVLLCVVQLINCPSVSLKTVCSTGHLTQGWKLEFITLRNKQTTVKFRMKNVMTAC